MCWLPAFILMPISWGSLPFDIAFFAAGIAGERTSQGAGSAQAATCICPRYYTLLPTSCGFVTAARSGTLDRITLPGEALLAPWERAVTYIYIAAVSLALFASGAVSVAFGRGNPFFPTQVCGSAECAAAAIALMPPLVPQACGEPIPPRSATSSPARRCLLSRPSLAFLRSPWRLLCSTAVLDTRQVV